MMNQMISRLRQMPVVASVKDDAALDEALKSTSQIVVLLYGDVTSIKGIVAKAKGAGKLVLVNLDMVDGYAPRAASVRDVKERTQADGILSSKAVLVKAAKDAGLIAVQRFFMIDSFAYHQMGSQLRNSKPDFLEILPGCVPRVIGWIKQDTDIPLIAGGLVCELEDVKAALLAGASAVATSDASLWNLRARGRAGQ